MALSDKRLNKPLLRLAQKLAKKRAAKPMASMPGGWGDTAATYRRLDTERCDWRAIIETFAGCAVQRKAGLPAALCLHDPVAWDLYGQTIEALSPLTYKTQRGVYLHRTCAVSTWRTAAADCARDQPFMRSRS